MPYRAPAVSADDIVVLRTAGASGVYHLHLGGMVLTPEKFTSFERAMVKGDEIAHARKVRLFYIDSPNEPPFVLRDYTNH
jgi:hypothetical protein